MKKRLFITTGSISLINVLSILKQNKSDEKYYDTLVIISFSMNEKFRETQKKIASLYSFQEILFVNKEKDLLKLLNIYEFDYVYSSTFKKLYSKLNKHKNFYIFDEGPGYAIGDTDGFSYSKCCYVTNFLNKFSFFKNDKNVKIEYIDKNIFNEISNKVLNILNENKKLTTSKNALFIGHYIYRKLGDENALKYYIDNINLLINYGYNVYFKGHPRDNESYVINKLRQTFKDNQYFHEMSNSLPIEIVNYNFDIVVGSYSGTLVSMPYYRNIPAINISLPNLYKSDVGLNYKKFFALYEEYGVSFDLLKDVLGFDKNIIFEKYNEIINFKKDIINNIELKKILSYKIPLYIQILCFILNIFSFKNKNILNFIDRIKYSGFYKLINAKFKFNL